MTRTFLAFVALGMFLSVSGCATDKRLGSNLPEMTEEHALINHIEQRLANDPVTARLRLGVESEDGVVTLSGRIDQPAVRMRAVSVVRGTPGVRGVIDKTLQF